MSNIHENKLVHAVNVGSVIKVNDFAFSDLSYYRYMLDLYANKGFDGISDEDLRFYTSKVLEASK